MRRRNIFISALVIAGLLVAFFATRSSGSDNGDVETTSSQNCPPIARLDAAATTPGNPVSIDVLANDTDPDGDPLVFQILKTTGGTSTVDDGATPTDASDDRVQFTPAIPPPPSATIEYQAVDPRGASTSSSVEVSINDLGTLPDDLRSEAVTSDEADDAALDDTASDDGDCGDTTVSSTSSSTTEVANTTSTTELVAEEDLSTTPTTRRGTSSKKKTTTTTAKKSTTSTTRGSSGTTQPTSPPPTDPPATTTPPPPPSSTTTNPPNECGPQPPYGPGPQPSDEWREWAECMGSD